MAVLSRREDDGGFYTRINIGGIATRQVHPDAVRYLTKRGVYVGDEIPPELMRKLRSTKHWLFTKDEFPFVIFPENRDPSFGTRRYTGGKAAIQGTTRVVSSEPIRKRKKSKPTRTRQKGAFVTATSNRSIVNPEWKQDPAQWSEPLLVDLAEDPSLSEGRFTRQSSYLSVSQPELEIQEEIDLSGLLIKKRHQLPDLTDYPEGLLEEGFGKVSFDKESLSGIRRWYEAGGYISAWLVFLVLIIISALGYWVSAMMDSIF